MKKLHEVLTNLDLHNKVKIFPDGAITFPGYLDKLEKMLSSEALISIREEDLLSFFNEATSIDVFVAKGAGEHAAGVIANQIKTILPKQISGAAKGAFFYISGNYSLRIWDVDEIVAAITPELNKEIKLVIAAPYDDEENAKYGLGSKYIEKEEDAKLDSKAKNDKRFGLDIYEELCSQDVTVILALIRGFG